LGAEPDVLIVRVPGRSGAAMRPASFGHLPVRDGGTNPMLEQERRARAAGGIGIATIAVIFSMISILVVGGGTQLPGAANAATSGRTYYVDSVGGNDTNSGTSASSAWRTLSKANSAPLVPGDQLLLRRGDTWTGSLQIIKSGTGAAPIMFDAYGTGAPPSLRVPERVSQSRGRTSSFAICTPTTAPGRASP
jgi:hypothetical protein